MIFQSKNLAKKARALQHLYEIFLSTNAHKCNGKRLGSIAR